MTLALICSVLATTLPGQSPPPSKKQQRLASAAQDLRTERLRASAMYDLITGGSEGAASVLEAFVAAKQQEGPRRNRTTIMYAKALADLGTTTRYILDELVREISNGEEPIRSHLLRALSNGALWATDQQRASIRAAIKTWAAKGILYSPSTDEPTFAWYEYVRLVRRMALASRGHDARAITEAMTHLRKERGAAPIGVAQLFEGQQVEDKFPHAAIESFGAHGQREQLEGIAELAIRCPDTSAAIIEELQAYLRLSPPREPRTRTEHCAGIGEYAPNELPGAKWPTKWLFDEWHFACARAVLVHSKDKEARTLALRHLLYASNIAMRLRAIEDVRQWPKPWQAFADDLRRCLGAGDRTIVRAAVLTISQDPELTAAAKTELQRLQQGKDRELAVMAKRALATND